MPNAQRTKCTTANRTLVSKESNARQMKSTTPLLANAIPTAQPDKSECALLNLHSGTQKPYTAKNAASTLPTGTPMLSNARSAPLTQSGTPITRSASQQ